MKKSTKTLLFVAIFTVVVFLGTQLFETGLDKLADYISDDSIVNSEEVIELTPNSEEDVEPTPDSEESDETIKLPESSEKNDKPVNLPENSSFDVQYLDVGQADAAIIQCDGHYMLIDGGNRNDSDLMYTVLEKRGITHFDYVIGTHAHEDHIGGIPGALKYATTDVVYCPVTEYDSKAFANFKRSADENGGIVIPKTGDSFDLGSAHCEIIACNAVPDDTNGTSIVMMITYGETKFLFTGDAERETEQVILDSGKDISCDVLKAGHHGSSTSTTYPFLREVMPKYAVVSCGKDNKYGHPHDETMSKFRDADVEVYRTDMQGDIFCTSDGTSVEMSSAR